MEIQQYQQEAKRTLHIMSDDRDRLHMVAGVISEVGEIVDIYKRHLAYGIIVKGKVTKSKVGIPYRKFEYYIEFGKGIIEEKEILDLSLERGLIKKGGPWFTISEDNKLQGEDAVIQFLQDNPEFTQELKNKILNGNTTISTGG